MISALLDKRITTFFRKEKTLHSYLFSLVAGAEQKKKEENRAAFTNLKGW